MTLPAGGYGNCGYGVMTYGPTASFCPTSWMQGFTLNAKQDTRYLGYDDVPGGLATDYSQHSGALTAGSTWWYTGDADGSRFDIPGTSGRELSFKFTAVSATSGCVMRFADTDESYKLMCLADGNVTLHVGTSSFGKVLLPSLSATEQDFSVMFTCRPNVLSGSAEDVLQHEAWAYNHTTDEYTGSFFTSNASPTLGSGTFTLAARTAGGADPLTNASIIRARVGDAYHSSVEWSEDYIALSDYPASSTLANEPRYDRDPILFDRSSGIGDQDQYYGPSTQQEALFRKRTIRRMASPLVNETLTNRRTFEPLNLPSSSLQVPGTSGWYWDIGWARHVELPQGLPYTAIRFAIHATVLSETDPDDGFVRYYAVNRLPTAPGPVLPALTMYHGGTITYARDAGTSTVLSSGSWSSGTIKPSSLLDDGSLDDANAATMWLIPAVSGSTSNGVRINAIQAWVSDEKLADEPFLPPAGGVNTSGPAFGGG